MYLECNRLWNVPCMSRACIVPLRLLVSPSSSDLFGDEWSHLQRKDDLCFGGSPRNVTRAQELQSAQWTCIQCYAAMHSASQTVALGAESPARQICVIHPPHGAYRSEFGKRMYGTGPGLWIHCADGHDGSARGSIHGRTPRLSKVTDLDNGGPRGDIVNRRDGSRSDLQGSGEGPNR